MKSLIGMADPIHHQYTTSGPPHLSNVSDDLDKGTFYCICHVTKMTSVWRALMDLSKSCICICALQISGFAGLPALHLSKPAVCICRQVKSTLVLEQRWISPKTIFVFLKSNHLHFWHVLKPEMKKMGTLKKKMGAKKLILVSMGTRVPKWEQCDGEEVNQRGPRGLQ